MVGAIDLRLKQKILIVTAAFLMGQYIYTAINVG